MTVDRFKKLFQYNYWANDKVWACIMALSEEQFTRPCSYSVGSLHAQVVHVMSADELWLERIRGGSVPGGLALPEDFPTREAIDAHWQTIRHDWIVYLDSLTEAELEEDIIYNNSTFQNKRWEALMQVLNHSTDHRAQILSLIHQVGGDTVAQDFIFYTRGK